MWTEWHLVGGNDSTHYESAWVPENKHQTGCTANCAAAEACGRQKMCGCRIGAGPNNPIPRRWQLKRGPNQEEAASWAKITPVGMLPKHTVCRPGRPMQPGCNLSECCNKPELWNQADLIKFIMAFLPITQTQLSVLAFPELSTPSHGFPKHTVWSTVCHCDSIINSILRSCDDQQTISDKWAKSNH